MKLILATLIAAGVGLAVPSDTATIHNLQSSALTNWPFSMPRFFAKGEIANYAQPILGGTPSTFWQCDVKTRWSDGSLQYAILSYRATVSGSGTLAITFQNSTNPSSAGNSSATLAAALTQTGMQNYDTGGGAGSWDADMELTNGTTKTVDIKTILNAWNGTDTGVNGTGVRYWLAGPVATQVIIEDKTISRPYDTGFATNNPIHPQFIATFYPGNGGSIANWGGVKIDIILENVWTGNRVPTGMQMIDDSYSVVLKTGATLASVYSQSTFTHSARTRWRQRCWSGTNAERTGNCTLGGTPQYVIDFNLAYMAYSGAIFNYDPSLVVPNSAFSPTNSASYQPSGGFSEVYIWAHKPDQGDNPTGNGEFDKSMGDPGARGDDKSPFCRWNVYYLYSMGNPGTDYWRMWDVMLGNGEVGAHVPLHYRDNLTGTAYCALAAQCVTDGQNAVDQLGKWVSISARQTMVLFPGRETGFGSTAADAVTTPASNTTGWLYELAHQYEWNYIAYLVTGDEYLLEELQADAEMASAQNLPSDNSPTCWYCHPLGHDYFDNENRGIAWGDRAVAEAAAMSVIGSAERSYWEQMLFDQLDTHEGFYNITTGHAGGAGTSWTFGHSIVANYPTGTFSANPLYMQPEADPFQDVSYVANNVVCCGAGIIDATLSANPGVLTVTTYQDVGATTGKTWAFNQGSTQLGHYVVTRNSATSYTLQGSSISQAQLISQWVNGTVNTDGACNVTYVSGSMWSTGYVGLQIFIAGSLYTIATAPSGTALTVNAPCPPMASGVTWVFQTPSSAMDSSPWESQPWTYNFNHLMWSHASDLGFTQVDVMRKKALLNFLHMLQDSSYSGYNGDSYYFPVYNTSQALFQTWIQVGAGLMPYDIGRTTWTRTTTDLEGSFTIILWGAAPLLSGIGLTDLDSNGSSTITGDNAYLFVKNNIGAGGTGQTNIASINALPKWAIIPRNNSGGTTGGTISGGSSKMGGTAVRQ